MLTGVIEGLIISGVGVSEKDVNEILVGISLSTANELDSGVETRDDSRRKLDALGSALTWVMEGLIISGVGVSEKDVNEILVGISLSTANELDSGVETRGDSRRELDALGSALTWVIEGLIISGVGVSEKDENEVLVGISLMTADELDSGVETRDDSRREADTLGSGVVSMISSTDELA